MTQAIIGRVGGGGHGSLSKKRYSGNILQQCVVDSLQYDMNDGG